MHIRKTQPTRKKRVKMSIELNIDQLKRHPKQFSFTEQGQYMMSFFSVKPNCFMWMLTKNKKGAWVINRYTTNTLAAYILFMVYIRVTSE